MIWVMPMDGNTGSNDEELIEFYFNHNNVVSSRIERNSDYQQTIRLKN